jgi:hypothetical protein
MLQLAGPFLVWWTQHYHTPRQQIGMPNADGCGEIPGPHWNKAQIFSKRTFGQMK